MIRRAGRQPGTPHGFTLVELLVAVAVFGIVSAAMFVALNEVLIGATASRAELERLAAIQRTFTVMADDFNQAAPRAVRNRFGDSEPAMIARDGRLAFTRAGHLDLRGRGGSTLRRVAWGLGGDDTLVRYSWPRLDRATGAEPAAQTLLAGVTGLRVRYRHDGEWRDDWPPPAPAGQAPALPRAVSIRLELDDHGALNRTFALP